MRSISSHESICWPLFSGQAVLLSPEPVSLGQWHRVVAERNKKAGHLRIDHGPVERMASPGKAQGLNIYTPMYLGGVPDMDILPKPANVSEMFKGCVGEVRAQLRDRNYSRFLSACSETFGRNSAGVHQQQEGGSVLQLHREQIHPQVCGQQPMWPPTLPQWWSLHVKCWIWVSVPVQGRFRRSVRLPQLFWRRAQNWLVAPKWNVFFSTTVVCSQP